MFVPGEEPHWLSDGGGEVGVSTTHRSIIEKGIGGGGYFIYGKPLIEIKWTSKKNQKKKLFYFRVLHISFILLIFAPSSLGPS